MKAVRLNAFNGPADMQLVDVPRPQPAAGEVLIKVKAAGINFAELELIAGRYSNGKQPPFIMAFEAAGVSLCRPFIPARAVPGCLRCTRPSVKSCSCREGAEVKILSSPQPVNKST
jgi:threonine dehydrogenase-like Zn-dependent dehydrogenase